MRTLVVALLAFGIAILSAQGAFDWQAGRYFYESDGSTWLNPHNSSATVGVFVQLIRDVGLDGIDGLVASGTGVVGDDAVWAVSWFGEDGFSAAHDGVWWDPGTGKAMSAGPTEDGYVFYARVFDTAASTWNGLSTAIPTGAGVHYWDGALWTYDDDFGLPVYDMTADEGGNVTVGTPVAIPEPMTIGLAFLGILLVRSFRRQRA